MQGLVIRVNDLFLGSAAHCTVNNGDEEMRDRDEDEDNRKDRMMKTKEQRDQITQREILTHVHHLSRDIKSSHVSFSNNAYQIEGNVEHLPMKTMVDNLVPLSYTTQKK
jgi:hypothetical protein